MSIQPVILRSLLAAAVSICVLTSCQTTDATLSGELPPPVVTSPDVAAGDAGVFQPGDNLELFVKEDPTLNSSYPVREGGYIVIPRAGRIPVAGMNRTAAEIKVKEALQRTQLTEASVLVERTSKQTLALNASGAAAIPKVMVYVTGAVPRPGTHFVPLPNGRSLGVYEALLITGGLGKFAQEQRVEVMRADPSGQRHRAVVDLRLVRQGTAQDPPVGEGDIIHVPQKVFGF